jgi:hypothetical protein
VFDMFKDYAEAEGLEGVLGRYDWTGVGPHQIYGAYLGRFPESLPATMTREGYTGQWHADQTLHSEEFQRQLLKLYLNAYNEKQRLVHIHIHKTAGTDLRRHLTSLFPWFHDSHTDPSQIGKTDLFKHLASVARAIDLRDAVLLTGHVPLYWYVDNGLCRYADRVFSVVREPRQIIVSYVNYILRRFYEDPACVGQDTKDWFQTLQLERLPVDLDSGDVLAFAGRILRNRQILFPNFLATALGHGTADSAFELMARTNIELTHIGSYKRWLKETWGIKSRTRENASPSYVKIDDFSEDQRNYIDELCVEDFKVYDAIEKALKRSKTCRVFGLELV